jgi:phosphocarrier protein
LYYFLLDGIEAAFPIVRSDPFGRDRWSLGYCSDALVHTVTERKVKILNKLGLHARPAALVVKTAERFISEISLLRDGLRVNGKSILGVMMLAAECGSEITVEASGPDSEKAVEAIAALILSKFQEE